MTTPDDAEPGSGAGSKLCPQCGARYDAGVVFCPRDGSALGTPSRGDLVGQLIAGRYRVIEPLGQGAMGRVYLAEHVKMERRCAIKVMSPELVSDADAISRFNREATNASRIQHPNVATVYDFGESADGLVFLAMEFVPGEALSRICDREHALPAARAANIARQVADGLDAAHDLGIIHRDLKPDNIMIAQAKDGRDIVKIVDFGIAKGTQQGAAGREALTRTGVVVGTLQYMSPEQLGGDPIDGRSDLYALGCMLYEMLTGESAFAGSTIEARLQRRLTGEPLHPRGVNPSVPVWLDALVAKALAREPGARFQTAADLRDALALGAGGAPSPSPSASPSPRARRLWFSAGALAGAATLVVLGMTWHRNETEQADASHPQVSVPSAPAPDSASVRAPAAVAPATADSSPPSASPRRQPAAARSSADVTPTSQLDLMQVQRAALAARQTAIDSGAAESSVRRGDRLMQAADSAIARRRFDLAMRAMLDARSTWRAASDSAAAVRLTEHAAVPSGSAAGPPPTPPSSPPPAGSPAHTIAAAPVDPTPGIQAAIATYARALASRDIAQLRAAYPALTADEARRWQEIFDATNSITASLSLAGPPHVSASGSADVDVTATFDFDYKRGADGERHPTVTYHAVLVRDGQQWKLASIK
ncbi:MAG TPA: serine/threonine-protein kinase [Gemmatimonadaceae bacterium]|nr:serine/threonine-protein kinase [Gemmatimonadaceae bacterium]